MVKSPPQEMSLMWVPRNRKGGEFHLLMMKNNCEFELLLFVYVFISLFSPKDKDVFDVGSTDKESEEEQEDEVVLVSSIDGEDDDR